MIVQSGAQSARRSRFLGTAFPPFSKPLLKIVTAASLAGLAAAPALAGSQLPTGGTVASGNVTIGTPANNSLTVTQTSSKAIINWQGFSVGSSNTVTIDNGSGATLNRVTGSAQSNIDGTLNATGSVYATGSVGIATTHIAGGLVGYNLGSLTDVYSAGPVQGGAAVGAIVGINGTTGTLTTAYFDGLVTGSLKQFGSNQNAGQTAVKLTTSHPPTAQASYVGFDFTSHWTIQPGETPTLTNHP
jgi:filamentous hemagglutinin family protein